MSSISDVILCLACTFFWVLWLVGTIFPTKIQHLYRSEGIVVKGDVLECYVRHGDGHGGQNVVITNNGEEDRESDNHPMDGTNGIVDLDVHGFDHNQGHPNDHRQLRHRKRFPEEDISEMNGQNGDTFDALNDLPTYNAIVSYVVPGPIASGKRRKRRIVNYETFRDFKAKELQSNQHLVLKKRQSEREISGSHTGSNTGINDYYLQQDLEKMRKAQPKKLEQNRFEPQLKEVKIVRNQSITDDAMEELNQKLSVDHRMAASLQGMKDHKPTLIGMGAGALAGTPPRPPKKGDAPIVNLPYSTPTPRKQQQRSPSPMSSISSNSPSSLANLPDTPDAQPEATGIRNRKLSKINEESSKRFSRAANNNQKSLLDSCTKSFESVSYHTVEKKMRKNEEFERFGFYKYNNNDDSDYYYSDNFDPERDEYENPEMIGNLFHSLGLCGGEKKVDKTLPSPVRVKKRFETNDLLKQGLKNVEIMVLPGNPGSGILKKEFELEEDYLLHGTISNDPEELMIEDLENGGNSGQMGDVTAGIIGVVLAAVSVIGAVHGALTLPYQTRSYGWIMVIVSLSLMWPAAMLTYKSVHKLRLFMLNKIISFEPCGDKTNLYGLSKLPRAKLATCSDSSAKGSDGSDAEYVIMLDTNESEVRKGIWSPSQDESSAVSSLSSHQIV